MVSTGLREVMLRAPGAGQLTGAGVQHGSAEHPVCGDQIELSVRLAGDRLGELRWLARGCPASMAVAALAGEVLAGVAVAEAPAALRAALQAHGGLAAHERHAEGLLLRALAAAVAAGSSAPGTGS